MQFQIQRERNRPRAGAACRSREKQVGMVISVDNVLGAASGRASRSLGRRAALSATTLLLGAIASILAVSPAFATGDANQSSCPAETEASPGFRTYLPDCRAYELVTPPYKEGATFLEGEGEAVVSPNGASVIVGAAGAFAGAGNYWYSPNKNGSFPAYKLTRTPEGWQPQVLTPSATEYPHSALMAVSAEDFETTLWGAGLTPLDFHENIYLRTGSGASEFRFVGPGTPENEKGEEVLAGDELSASEELNFVGGSRNLSRSVFAINVSAAEGVTRHQGHSDLWPGDTTQPSAPSLYEYVGTGNHEPTLVGVENEGALSGEHHINESAKLISDCGTELGSGSEGSAYNAVSESGEDVYFTALHKSSGGTNTCSKPAANELYARVGGERTVGISEPSKADCEACNTTTGLKSAIFEGASEDGEKAFFLTEQELLPGQIGRYNLYEYDFNGPQASPAHPDGKLTLISSGATKPEVQGVVRVSENGERVYFVAKGVLAGENLEKRSPEAGADNLYVYEPDPDHMGGHRTVFVAKLLTPSEESGLTSEEAQEASKVNELAEKAALKAFEEAIEHGASFEEAFPIYEEIYGQQHSELTGALGPGGSLSQDTSTWALSDYRRAQATANGDFLVFLSSAHLTTGDTSGVPQVFEYDAERESLTRVSIGQSGSSSGNVDTFNDAPYIPAQSFQGVDGPTTASVGRALSEDGSRLFFTSEADLTLQAEAGTTNVYEYREGNLYLISGGNDSSRVIGASTVRLLGVDPSAADVFFTSASRLVPQYGETQAALYDAREDGGFPGLPLRATCSAELCRGGVASAPQLAAGAASATQRPGGSLARSAAAKKRKQTQQNKSARKRKLAQAMQACQKKHSGSRRAACERRAQKRYGAAATTRRSMPSRKRGK